MAKSGRYTFAVLCAVTFGAACRFGYQPDFEGGPNGVSPQRSITTGAAAAESGAGQAATDAGLGGAALEVVGGDGSGGVATLGGEPAISGSGGSAKGGSSNGGAGAGGTSGGGAPKGGSSNGGSSGTSGGGSGGASGGSSSGGGSGAPVDACGGCALGKACIAGTCLPAKRVFITEATSLPNYGNAASANQICQTTATTQKLGGTWLAWISDNKFSPATDFKQSADPYVLLDGTIVANNWADLIDGSLAHQIDMNELRGNVGARETWTGTAIDGTSSGSNCNNWKSSANADLGTNGVSSVGNYGWTISYDQFCDRWVSLYCFEQ